MALRRWSASLLGAFVVLLAAGPDGRAESEGSSGPVRLTIGYSSRIFVDVDVEEARAIAQVWTDQILRRRFGEASARILVFQDDSSLEASFRRKEVDLAALVPVEYIQLARRVPVDPVFVTAHDRGLYRNAVLLVRRDSGFRRLLDLKGKRLALSREQSTTIDLKWLEVLLMREGFRRKEDFFPTVRDTRRPSQAILSVFFGQSDACLTTLEAFRLVGELNPQVERDLLPLARSPDLSAGVIVFRSDYGEGDKARLTEGFETLHLDLEGKQLLRLFRMTRLVRFQPEYLETVKALLAEHEGLRKSLAGRK